MRYPTHCPKGHEYAVVGRLRNGHCAECARFCPKGHEVAVVGRTAQGTCLLCNREAASARARKRFAEDKARGDFWWRTKYCPKGHEIAVVGRLANGHCAECARFCPQGHEFALTGKTKYGRCAVCARTNAQKYHQQQIASRGDFCKNGHDLRIVGRRVNGLCKECAKRSKRTNARPGYCSKDKHLLAEVGKYKGGGCAQCSRDYAKEAAERYRRKNGIVPRERATGDQRLQVHTRQYRMTFEQYEALMQEQGRVCAICGNPEITVDPKTGKAWVLAVDHDHQTKTNRGLLCSRCNIGIGYLRDSPDLLLAARDYLLKWKAKHANPNS